MQKTKDDKKVQIKKIISFWNQEFPSKHDLVVRNIKEIIEYWPLKTSMCLNYIP